MTRFVTQAVDRSTILVLAASFPDELPPDCDAILTALARLFVEFTRRHRIDLLHDRLASGNRLFAFLAALHGSLDERQILHVLATDGASAAAVDRISVLQRIGRRWRLTAATGVGRPADRADATRRLEKVLTAWSDTESDASSGWLNAEDADRLTGARRLAVDCANENGSSHIRIDTSFSAAGWSDCETAILTEQFTSAVPETDLLPQLCRHAVMALDNSSATTSRLRRGMRRLFTSGWKAALLIGLIILALMMIPTDFEIEVYGQVAARKRQRIFAPEAGVIRLVNVDNADAVVEGQKLVVIDSAELELRRESLLTEKNTATARLAALEAFRPGADSGMPQMNGPGTEELREAIRGLTAEIAIVDRQLKTLSVPAPFAGAVFRDDLRQELTGRRVQHGEFLFVLADPAAGWMIELRIPDRQIRHVLAARSASDSPLPVQFVLSMSPTKTWSATLDTLSPITELDDVGELSARAAVPVDLQDEAVRPGSGVVARIHCGRASLGYVWFRELIEFVRIRVLF